MTKPHLIKICEGWWEAHVRIDAKHVVRIGNGANPFQAWHWAVWGVEA